MLGKQTNMKNKILKQQKVNIDEKESNVDSQDEYDQENNQFNNKPNE